MQQEKPSSEKFNPITLAIYTAAAAALGNLLVSYVNGRNQLRVELIRAEQALVLEAIKTGGDTDKASENLRFLVQAGLLQERGAAIQNALKQGSQPSLPATIARQITNTSEGSTPLQQITMRECLEQVHLILPGERSGSPVMRQVIRTFQQKHDLEITGLLGDETRKRAAEICGIRP